MADLESCANFFSLSLFFFFGWKTFKYVLFSIILATFLEKCLLVSSLSQLPHSFVHWYKILKICLCEAHALDFKWRLIHLWCIFSDPFYRWRNWGWDRNYDLFQVTHLETQVFFHSEVYSLCSCLPFSLLLFTQSRFLAGFLCGGLGPKSWGCSDRQDGNHLCHVITHISNYPIRSSSRITTSNLPGPRHLSSRIFSAPGILTLHLAGLQMNIFLCVVHGRLLRERSPSRHQHGMLWEPIP